MESKMTILSENSKLKQYSSLLSSSSLFPFLFFPLPLLPWLPFLLLERRKKERERKRSENKNENENKKGMRQSSI
jgi:hypothetical protein